jgi:hypothetical protein
MKEAATIDGRVEWLKAFPVWILARFIAETAFDEFTRWKLPLLRRKPKGKNTA